jgi:hypothetical protein
MDTEVVGRIANKKGSDVQLWNSEARAAKGALGPADGSRSMLDALHHAAITVRRRGTDAAREQLQRAGLMGEPAFLAAFEALLEVLPPSRQFTGIDPTAAAAPAASDFDALEKLRRRAFEQQIDPPEQLKLFVAEAA